MDRLWRKDWNCSKLIKIGRLRIHYHETHYDKGFQGKLQSIGAVKFNYFIENAINKKAGISVYSKIKLGMTQRL